MNASNPWKLVFLQKMQNPCLFFHYLQNILAKPSYSSIQMFERKLLKI